MPTLLKLLKFCIGRNSYKLILWGHHNTDKKTRQRHHQKRKLQDNITDDWASRIGQLVKSHLQCSRLQFNSWAGKISWRRDQLPIPVFMGFPGISDSKESVCNVGDLGLVPGLGGSPEEGYSNPLQFSCLKNQWTEYILVSYSPWSHKDVDMMAWLSISHHWWT